MVIFFFQIQWVNNLFNFEKYSEFPGILNKKRKEKVVSMWLHSAFIDEIFFSKKKRKNCMNITKYLHIESNWFYLFETASCYFLRTIFLNDQNQIKLKSKWKLLRNEEREENHKNSLLDCMHLLMSLSLTSKLKLQKKIPDMRDKEVNGFFLPEPEN